MTSSFVFFFFFHFQLQKAISVLLHAIVTINHKHILLSLKTMFCDFKNVPSMPSKHSDLQTEQEMNEKLILKWKTLLKSGRTAADICKVSHRDRSLSYIPEATFSWHEMFPHKNMKSQIFSASSLQLLHVLIEPFVKLPTKPIRDNLLVTKVSITVPLKLNHTLWHSPKSTLWLHNHSCLSNLIEVSHYGLSEMSYRGKHTPASTRRSINLIRLILIDLQMSLSVLGIPAINKTSGW